MFSGMKLLAPGISSSRADPRLSASVESLRSNYMSVTRSATRRRRSAPLDQALCDAMKSRDLAMQKAQVSQCAASVFTSVANCVVERFSRASRRRRC